MNETVKQYYNIYGAMEKERMSSVYCTFEYGNNLRLMEKYLPPSGSVLDAGAGPGQYSLPLMKRGYRVTLLDISEKLLAVATADFEKENVVPEKIICDDVCNMEQFEDEVYDAVLVMGPMYHLLEPADRTKVLSHTKRILKKDGIAMVEFLNAWGVLRTGIDEFPEEYKVMENLTRYFDAFSIDSRFEMVTDFTDVYLSTPPVAAEMLGSAGFELISYAGTESFASGMRQGIDKIHEENITVFNNIVEASFLVCERHPFRDVTEHMTFIVRKS